MMRRSLFILLLPFLIGCSAVNGNDSSRVFEDLDPIFNESEEDTIEKFGFDENDDRYGTSYDYYTKYSESRIGYSGGWTLTYAEENDIVMCSVFYKDNLPVIGIGNGIFSIKWSQVSNGKGVKTIIDNGDKINSIKFSKNLKYINRSAFEGCTGLRSIFIPSTVTFIGDYAFKGCTNLTIRCQVSQKPSGWSDKWNQYSKNCTVLWGCSN